MLPDFARLCICAFSNHHYHEQQRQMFKDPVFEGVNASALFDAACTRIRTAQVGPEFVVSGACEVAALDLHTLPRSEAGQVDAEFRLDPKCSCDVHGLCVYFSVEFGGGGHCLDSSPWGDPTHWQQSVMLFKEPLRVHEGREVPGRLQMRPLGRRAIEMRLQIGGRPRQEVWQFLKR